MSTPPPHEAVVVRPGAGRRLGNVEFLCLSADSPRLNVSVITMLAGRRGPPAHRHEDEDDAFFILQGEMTFIVGEQEIVARTGTFVLVPPGVEHTFANRGSVAARMLNIHAPAGFDRRLLGDA